jgi:hypothetical protein
MSKIIIALIVGVLLGAAGTWVFSAAPQTVSVPQAEHPTQALTTLPDLPVPYYTVLFENDAVRIVDHQLEPGGVEPEHTHAPMLAYFIEGATLMITEADGFASEATIPTGAFLGAENLRWWTHALENTGETRLHTILIELKHDVPEG